MFKKRVLGVLGLGEGRSIMSAALKSELWELGAVCDLDRGLCERRCAEFGVDRYTTDYGELLADPEIDTIGVYTPDQLHADHAMRALRAGKDVICTKPLAVGLDRARELLDCQRETGRALFVGQSSRFFEPLIRQRADFERGAHGELVSAETSYVTDARWFLAKNWSRAAGFSWMYNFLIHAVDLAAWYLPEIEEVYGAGAASANSRAYGLSVPDALSFILKDAAGRFAVVRGSYATPTLSGGSEQSISCTLRGTGGVSSAGYPKLQYLSSFPGEGTPERMELFRDRHPYYFRFEGESHHAGEYQNYIEYFARRLDAGETPKPDLREGIRTIAVMEALSESLSTGKSVRVSEVLARREIEL
jgi:predicted dehydrogenase